MPVSFDLTEHQLELQKWVHEFAGDRLLGGRDKLDERLARRMGIGSSHPSRGADVGRASGTG